MPEFTSVRDAALSIRRVLRTAITLSDEPSLTGIDVDLRSPRELELAGVTGVVSLWTHRIDVQPDLVNHPPRRSSTELEARRSLPVELVMHATVVDDDASVVLLVTGRILQALFDHRRLADPDLVGSLEASGTELLVAFEQFTAYDTNLVWSGLHSHQRVGTAIRVSGVLIESELSPIPTARVLTREMTDARILEMT